MWEKASCGSQSVEKLILSNDKCIIINFACFFAHVLFSPVFHKGMHPFLKVLILSQEFYKSKKKKNCAEQQNPPRVKPASKVSHCPTPPNFQSVITRNSFCTVNSDQHQFTFSLYILPLNSINHKRLKIEETAQQRKTL